MSIIDYKTINAQLKHNKQKKYQEKLDTLKLLKKMALESQSNNMSKNFYTIEKNHNMYNVQNMDQEQNEEQEYYLGQTYSDGKEQINLEFKEFCLKRQPDLLMTNEEIEYIILYGRWSHKMTKLLQMSMNDYFNFVVPKYIACYSNSCIDGKLIIGIDDYGEITGIPSIYSFNKNYFKNKLAKSLKNQLYSEQKKTIGEILNNIEIKVIKLKCESYLLDDEIEKYYTVYKNLMDNHDKQMKKYIEERAQWGKQLEPYLKKLSEIANNKYHREKITELIMNKAQNYKKTQCHNIKLLKSSDNIYIPIGENLPEFKDNELSIIHWVIKYKDTMTDYYCGLKPKKPFLMNCYGLSQMLAKLSHMRKRFIEQENMDYYMIEINIFGSKLKPSLYYKSSDSTEWKYRKRLINNCGEPSCN
jgi:hypothetical protein